jgi:hypothetical protein
MIKTHRDLDIEITIYLQIISYIDTPDPGEKQVSENTHFCDKSYPKFNPNNITMSGVWRRMSVVPPAPLSFQSPRGLMLVTTEPSEARDGNP